MLICILIELYNMTYIILYISFYVYTYIELYVIALLYAFYDGNASRSASWPPAAAPAPWSPRSSACTSGASAPTSNDTKKRYHKPLIRYIYNYI